MWEYIAAGIGAAGIGALLPVIFPSDDKRQATNLEAVVRETCRFIKTVAPTDPLFIIKTPYERGTPFDHPDVRAAIDWRKAQGAKVIERTVHTSKPFMVSNTNSAEYTSDYSEMDVYLGWAYPLSGQRLQERAAQLTGINS